MRVGFYPGYRFPIEIIRHAVWLYHRFCLSLRDISDLLLQRGIVVSHETIREWCLDFGPDFATQIKKRRPQPGSTWHLDGWRVKLCVRDECYGSLQFFWAIQQNIGITSKARNEMLGLVRVHGSSLPGKLDS